MAGRSLGQAWSEAIAAPPVEQVKRKSRGKLRLVTAVGAGTVLAGGAGLGAREYAQRRRSDVAKSQSAGAAAWREEKGPKPVRRRTPAVEGKTHRQVRAERRAATAAQRAAYAAAHEPPVERTWASRLARLKMPNRYVAGSLAAAAGGAGAYELASKADRRDAAVAGGTAAAGAAGAAGSVGAYQLAGYKASKFVERKQREELTSRERSIVRAHRRAHGIGAGEDFVKAPAKVKDEYFRTYPENVKYSGARRLLARTHGSRNPGRLAVPVGAVGASIAAATAAGHGRKQVSKRLVPVKLPTAKMGPRRVPVKSLGQRYRDELAAHLESSGTSTVTNGVRKDLLMPSWNRLGIPPWRVDPISPLVTLASGNVMLDVANAAMGVNLNRRRRKAAQKQAYAFSGAMGMMGSPMGAGRKVVQ